MVYKRIPKHCGICDRDFVSGMAYASHRRGNKHQLKRKAMGLEYRLRGKLREKEIEEEEKKDGLR